MLISLAQRLAVKGWGCMDQIAASLSQPQLLICWLERVSGLLELSTSHLELSDTACHWFFPNLTHAASSSATPWALAALTPAYKLLVCCWSHFLMILMDLNPRKCDAAALHFQAPRRRSNPSQTHANQLSSAGIGCFDLFMGNENKWRRRTADIGFCF